MEILNENIEFRKKLTSRLNRIEGQIKGIQKMVENKVQCDDILNQISSVRSALNGIAKVILESHMKRCVISEIKAKKEKEAIENLIILLEDLLNKKGILKKNNNDKVEIFQRVREQIDKIRRKISDNECCSGILKDITLVKCELEITSKEILDRHIKKCLVTGIKQGMESKIIDDFLYTINKMIK